MFLFRCLGYSNQSVLTWLRRQLAPDSQSARTRGGNRGRNNARRGQGGSNLHQAESTPFGSRQWNDRGRLTSFQRESIARDEGLAASYALARSVECNILMFS